MGSNTNYIKWNALGEDNPFWIYAFAANGKVIDVFGNEWVRQPNDSKIIKSNEAEFNDAMHEYSIMSKEPIDGDIVIQLQYPHHRVVFESNRMKPHNVMNPSGSMLICPRPEVFTTSKAIDIVNHAYEELMKEVGKDNEYGGCGQLVDIVTEKLTAWPN